MFSFSIKVITTYSSYSHRIEIKLLIIEQDYKVLAIIFYQVFFLHDIALSGIFTVNFHVF